MAKKTPLQKAEAKADRLVGAWVRADRRCFADGWPGLPPSDGVWQAAHLMNRSQSKVVKFSPLNYGGCLSRSAHVWLTHRPHEWFMLCEERLPGLLERVVRMQRWCESHSALIDRVEANLWYAEFAERAMETGLSYLDWQRERVNYMDYVEQRMEELA